MRTALLLATAGLLLVACSDDDDGLDAAAVLERVEPAVALVTTGLAGGSGVVVEDDGTAFVVTNVHVVDPAAAVDLTFPDGTVLTDVEVVASDPFLDLAIVGPVELDGVEPLVIASAEELVRTDRVYLVGYPGETDADAVATISEGIVSRLRTPDDWPEHLFVQSDNAIGGGQSGGALVDDEGRLVGISGYSFAEQFALSIDATEVAELLDDRDGDRTGPAWFSPVEADRRQLSVPLADPRSFVELWFAPGEGEAELTVDGADDPIVIAGDLGSFVQATAAGTRLLDEVLGAAGLAPASEPIGGSPFRITLDPDIATRVIVGSGRQRPTTLVIAADVDFAASDPFGEPTELDPGERVEFIVEGSELYERFDVKLLAGDEVEIRVDGPIADPFVTVVAPGASVDEGESFDDDGTGLFGVDASGVFTAETDGVHQVFVSTYDVEAVGLAIEIRASGMVDGADPT